MFVSCLNTHAQLFSPTNLLITKEVFLFVCLSFLESVPIQSGELWTVVSHNDTTETSGMIKAQLVYIAISAWRTILNAVK